MLKLLLLLVWIYLYPTISCSFIARQPWSFAMAPPWLSTTLNSEHIDDTDFVGSVLEVKGLIDGKRVGNFVAVCLASISELKTKKLELRICGTQEKELWTTVEKKWQNPSWFFLSRKTSTESVPYKDKKRQVVKPICTLRILTVDEVEKVEWLTKRSICIQHVKRILGELREEGLIPDDAADKKGGKAKKKAQLTEGKKPKKGKDAERGEDGEAPAKSRKRGNRGRGNSSCAAAALWDSDDDPEDESEEEEKVDGEAREAPRDPDVREVGGGRRKDGGRREEVGRGTKVQEDLRKLRNELTEGQGRKRSDDKERRRPEGPPREARQGSAPDREGPENLAGRPVAAAQDRSRRSAGPASDPFSGQPAATEHAEINQRHRGRDRRGRKRRSRDRSRSDSVSTCSEASQVFRDASTSACKPSRQRLVRYAERHPGQLAARFLRKMRSKVVVEGEASDSNARSLPACAKAYHLRVTQTSYPEAGKRNLAEGSILAHVLDHLASQRYGQAADILAQRYTALEAVNAGIPWERARFLELVGEEDHSLVGQHERALVANEAAKSLKIGTNSNTWKGSGWEWPPKGKGKFKGNPFVDQAPAQQALADGTPTDGAGKGDAKNSTKGKQKGKGKGKWW